MRITLGMISNRYNKNLNKSLGSMNNALNRSTTFRKFDKASEDPMSASKAYHLRREYIKNESYKSNLSEVQGFMDTAQSSVMNINNIIQEAASSDCIQAINGTLGPEERKAIAAKLKVMQDAVVSRMNDKYGDKNIFSGNDTTTQPFSVSNTEKLLYRGVDVTTGKHIGAEAVSAGVSVGNTKVDIGKANGAALNGFTVNVSSTEASNFDATQKVITVNLTDPSTKQDLQDALRAVLAGNVPDENEINVSGNLIDSIIVDKKGEISGGVDAIAAGTDVSLNALANQTMYVDIGLGLKIKANGEVVPQSAFNISLPGISILGFGENADGIPNNLHSLLGEIAAKLEEPTFDYEGLKPYLKNFSNQQQNLLTKLTEFGAKTNMLDYVEEKAKDMDINLLDKINSVEFLEPEVALMDFKMQEFAYRAALQMGNKILQPSLLDFLR